jgi:hypothetical protein
LTVRPDLRGRLAAGPTLRRRPSSSMRTVCLAQGCAPFRAIALAQNRGGVCPRRPRRPTANRRSGRPRRGAALVVRGHLNSGPSLAPTLRAGTRASWLSAGRPPPQDEVRWATGPAPRRAETVTPWHGEGRRPVRRSSQCQAASRPSRGGSIRSARCRRAARGGGTAETQRGRTR